jgi:hypothetical protein
VKYGRLTLRSKGSRVARTDAVDRYVSPRDSLNFNILGSPPGAVVAAASAAAAAASSAPSPPPLAAVATAERSHRRLDRREFLDGDHGRRRPIGDERLEPGQ